MSNRRLHRNTPDQIALNAVDGVVSLEEGAQLFVDCDWGQDPISYLIPEAKIVEQLAYEPPQDPKERAELQAEVRAFFWHWLENATDAERDKPAQQQIYPL